VPDPATTDVLVTVVMACRDAAATLPAQLDALVAQVLPPELVGRWQLLVCDDASGDDSRAIAEGYRDRLPLTVLAVDGPAGPGTRGPTIRAGGLGPGAARNWGAARASGSLLAFCDADDVVAPDWLARMVAALADHRFVAGRFATDLNAAAVLRSRTLGQQDRLQGGPRGLPHAGGGNLGIRREVFEAVGGFDPSLRCLEDTDLSWRVQQAGVVLVFAADVVVRVRLRSTLATMFGQGRGYGAAYAELERRHSADSLSADTSTGSTVTADTVTTHRPGWDDEGPGTSGRWRAWVGSPASLGHLVWQLGWAFGHRSGR
jgi:cellulose synthase/poly-beta-1,6-N-acetylglucosamine synthase-like glycosyltransferase